MAAYAWLSDGNDSRRWLCCVKGTPPDDDDDDDNITVVINVIVIIIRWCALDIASSPWVITIRQSCISHYHAASPVYPPRSGQWLHCLSRLLNTMCAGLNQLKVRPGWVQLPGYTEWLAKISNAACFEMKFLDRQDGSTLSTVLCNCCHFWSHDLKDREKCVCFYCQGQSMCIKHWHKLLSGSHSPG